MKKEGQVVALLQVLILFVGIVSVGYLLGSEVGIVSATKPAITKIPVNSWQEAGSFSEINIDSILSNKKLSKNDLSLVKDLFRDQISDPNMFFAEKGELQFKITGDSVKLERWRMPGKKFHDTGIESEISLEINKETYPQLKELGIDLTPFKKATFNQIADSKISITDSINANTLNTQLSKTGDWKVIGEVEHGSFFSPEGAGVTKIELRNLITEPYMNKSSYYVYF